MITEQSKRVLAAMLFGGALLVSGCGRSGPQRNEVRGQVTYKGQPVPAGLVRLTPDRAKGNSGPGAIASIENGAFRTKSGKGVVTGPHLIVVAGFDGVPQPDGSLPEGAALFEPYTLPWDFKNEASRVEIEVPLKKVR